MSSKLSKVVLTMACMAGFSASFVQARTFAAPHVFDQKGRISNTPFTFDTTLFFDYAGTIEATVGMQFFGGNDAPLECDLGPMPPFSSVIPAQQSLSVSMEDIADPVGGFPQDGHIRLGYGIFVVGGADPENVAIQGFVVNSHTSAFDLSVFGFEPVPISSSSAVQRTLVIPHVLETSGTLSSSNSTPVYDTEISLLYAAGMGDLPDGATGECSVGITVGGVELLPRLRLGSAQGALRSATLRLDDLLVAAGLPTDFAGPVSLDVTGDAWALSSTAFVQHGLDVSNLDDESFFLNAAVPEPTSLALLGASAVLLLRRKM